MTDAFLLLTISSCTLQSSSFGTKFGTLGLECVTLHDQVYLVFRLDDLEIPIDPTRLIRSHLDHGARLYKFSPTEIDPSELTLTITVPEDVQPYLLEDIDSFEGILQQYARFEGPTKLGSLLTKSLVPPTKADLAAPGIKDPELKGKLVLVNQDNGEVVGEFSDQKFQVKEDPNLWSKGNEDAPVVIEIQEQEPGNESPREAFARAVPPEQRDWITTGATLVSHAISKSSNLLLMVVTSASSYYISHSTPSPNPSRAQSFLASEQTRKGLGTIHAVSGQAVKVSSKTIALIDSMIGRAIGMKKKAVPVAGTSTPLSPPNSPAPPPYSATLGIDGKPSLPPRRPSPSPASSPSFPSTSYSALSPSFPSSPSASSSALVSPSGSAPALPPRLSTKARVILSADLILSTIDQSAKELLNVGSQQISAVVGHKYGAEAGQSSLSLTGTAKNLALVYIDMSGIGRKALIKRAGKMYIKNKLGGGGK
ncbi:hypothetical protein C8J56DRAFT_459751 [Mycena floridula]|nr:hypothetical protein C8J56DRAFT_459751 [Mycena floridula]